MSDKFATFKSGKGITSSVVTPGLGGAVAEILAAALKGLEHGADLVMDESQRRVPVLDPAQESKERPSGELKATGHVEMQPKSKRAALKYGTPYAVYQHERMDLKHPSGGQAKYLESAMLEKSEEVLAKVAEEIRKVTEK